MDGKDQKFPEKITYLEGGRRRKRKQVNQIFFSVNFAHFNCLTTTVSFVCDECQKIIKRIFDTTAQVITSSFTSSVKVLIL